MWRRAPGGIGGGALVDVEEGPWWVWRRTPGGCGGGLPPWDLSVGAENAPGVPCSKCAVAHSSETSVETSGDTVFLVRYIVVKPPSNLGHAGSGCSRVV